MERWQLALLWGLLVVAVFALMWWGWRSRAKRHPAPEFLAVPVELGPASLVVELHYVVTTRAGQPLERIAGGGLGFRGKATVAVHGEGVALGILGSQLRFLPREHLLGAGPASWAIDRAVERDGLVVLSWQQDSGEYDCYLRPARSEDSAALIAAVQKLVPAAPNNTKEQQ